MHLTLQSVVLSLGRIQRFMLEHELAVWIGPVPTAVRGEKASAASIVAPTTPGTPAKLKSSPLAGCVRTNGLQSCSRTYQSFNMHSHCRINTVHVQAASRCAVHIYNVRCCSPHCPKLK